MNKERYVALVRAETREIFVKFAAAAGNVRAGSFFVTIPPELLTGDEFRELVHTAGVTSLSQNTRVECTQDDAEANKWCVSYRFV